MKKILLAAGLILMAMILTSCGSTKHCDAYGDKGESKQELKVA